VRRFSSSASLDRGRASRHIHRAHFPSFYTSTYVAVVVHRFEESIGGRAYLIEVAKVAQDRWRACIVRTPGVPTALMPFYGATPDEAARSLTGWLTRAHEPPPPPRPRVGVGAVKDDPQTRR
jgi:hypothetical protein